MTHKLPEGWREVEIGNVAQVLGGGTPSTSEPSYWDGEIPWLTPSEFTKNEGNTIEESERYITKKGLKNSSAILLDAGSVLMTSRATIGYCRINTQPVTTNQGFASFRCNENVYNYYLLYMLRFMKNRLLALSSGSTFMEISKSELKRLQISLPPLEEQRKIAEILGTVDGKLTNIDQQITTTETLKKGLMQQLFTKGIGHTEFKQTEIGTIPKEWEVVKLSDVCTLRGGTGFKEEYQGNVSGEFPFIKVSDMNLKGNETYIQTSNNWVSAIDVKSMKGVVFAANTVVFAKVGAALLLNRRRILTRDTLIDNNMMGATPKELIISSFLYLVLLQKDFGKLVQEGAVPSINQTQLGAIRIPLPPLDEQEKIASILTEVDNKIDSLKKRKSAYTTLKTGLMQQLLTGQKRVKV